MDRVVALVVQPGVDMGNTQVFGYDKAKAAALSAAVADIPGVVYEAHSTDFQSEAALADLVATHFPILKVGPSLTFAFREAVFALAAIEERCSPGRTLADRRDARAGDGRQPEHWRDYVAADGDERLTGSIGLSDRIRYYWPEPASQAALSRCRQRRRRRRSARPRLAIRRRHAARAREPTLSSASSSESRRGRRQISPRQRRDRRGA